MVCLATIVVFLTSLTVIIGTAETTNTNQQSSKHQSVENECSLTKTVFELNAELKISIFKLETWKGEIDRQLENLKSVEQTIKSRIDELSTKLDTQSKEMGVMDTMLTSEMNTMRENLETAIRDGDRNIKADIIELHTKLQNQTISSATQTQNVETKITNLESQIIGMEEDFRNDVKNASTTMKNTFDALPHTITAFIRNHTIGGATYVRWGASSCGGKSSIIYSGVLGGGHYTHTGAAVNSLCLPKNPELKDHVGGSVTYIYGAEYEFGSSHQYDIPCAVCDTGSKTKVFMLPAKSTCPKGWNKEYSGMLVAGYYGHKASTDYDCFDESMEPIPSTQKNDNGKVFYYVESGCGSLPCPPYAAKKRLTCAVCSA